MKKVNIVLVDWNGYRFHRTKKLGYNLIKCGLGRILGRLADVKPGIEFDLHLVINFKESTSHFKWYRPATWITMFNMPSKRAYYSLKGKYPFIKSVNFRDNIGMDIGAYDYGIKMLRSQNYEGDLILMNTSAVGPKQDNWLIKYQTLFNQQPNTGLCGITLNSHLTNPNNPIFMPHVQSFFLYTNIKILSRISCPDLPGSFVSSDKGQLIDEGEIGISKAVLNSGYSIRCSAFPNFIYKNDDEWTIPQGDIRYRKKYRKFCNQI
jgi:hypothetical protein